jgi:hypothetical protein
MRSSSLVILPSDPLRDNSSLTLSLVASLRTSFQSVRTVRSFHDLRSTVAGQLVDVAVVDVESVPLADVARLSRDFSGLRIVCTHRLPDDQLWTEALGAGAADLCPSSDISAILTAAHRGGIKHPTAA